MSTRRYGWKPDLPDFRDHRFKGSTEPTSLPVSMDLRRYDGEIYDQGQLGSCTSNAIAANMQSLCNKAGRPFMPSRLFIYYNERVIEGTVDQDAGASLRTGMKTVANQGACPESMWPYDVVMFAVKPTEDCYIDALNHQILSYQRLDVNLMDMKQCIADGFPFVFGFTVYQSFESEGVASTGIMPMPTDDDRALGGHAVMCVGYDDNTERMIVRNSWGQDWGDQGYFYMPYAYISNADLCDDFWTIREIELTGTPNGN